MYRKVAAGLIMSVTLCYYAHSAEELWETSLPLPNYQRLPLLKKVEHHRIHTSGDDYHFLLGVSIVEHKGVFYAAWGASEKDENDSKSTFAYKTSKDANTWSDMKIVAPNPEGPDAYSHGVLLSSDGKLWAFAPRAEFGNILLYPHLRMEVFQFDETKQEWHSRGETASGFWPLCEPQLMDDGNWIMGGAVPHKHPSCDAAVAISDGNDLTKWTIVKIPSEQITWGETTLVVNGQTVRAYIRPPKNGHPLITALSEDFGRTWNQQTNSNLPVSASKPYAGMLKNGSRYLIVNITVPGLQPRDTLAIALSRPGASAFSDLRIIRKGKSPAPTSRGAGISRQWAYPYAVEQDGKLYVVYASTKQNAELSIVDLSILASDSSITD